MVSSSFYLDEAGPRKKLPNLVFLVFRADGTRDIGPRSQLAKCLRLYNQPGLNMIDQWNLVVVLTFARKIEFDDGEWIASAAKKKEQISNFLKEEIGWAPPIEFIENKPPKQMKRCGDFTLFPDGVQQPLNLFDPISNLLSDKQDIIGKEAVREFFARKKAKSKLIVTVGKEVMASIEGEIPMNEEEGQIFGYIQEGGQASSASSALSYREKVLDWRMSKATGLHMSDGESEEEKCGKELGVHVSSGNTIPNHILEAEEFVIGRGYNSTDQIMMNEQIIAAKEFPLCMTQYEKNQNSSKKFSNTDKNAYDNDVRSGGNVDPTLRLAAKVKKSSESNQLSQHSSIYVGRVRLAMTQSFKEKLRSEAGKDCFNGSFVKSLMALNKKKPIKSNKKGEAQIDNSFRKFFDNYGEGVIIEARGGGQIMIEQHTLDMADTTGAGLDGSWIETFSGSMNHLKEFSHQHNSGKWEFQGGNGAFHHKDKLDEWRESLTDLPTFFLMDGDKFDPWPDFVDRLAWLPEHKEISRALQIAHDAKFRSTREEAAEKDQQKEISRMRKLFGWTLW